MSFPNKQGVVDRLETAAKANVAKLVLFHHDPYHTDDELEEGLAIVRESVGAVSD